MGEHDRAIARGRSRNLGAVNLAELRADASAMPLIDQLVERAKAEVLALIRDPDHANWYRQLVASPGS